MMKTNKKLKLAASALVVASWLVVGIVQADDTDIYGGAPGAAAAPNLMILADNSANWSANNQQWHAKGVYTKCKAKQGQTLATCQAMVKMFFPAIVLDSNSGIADAYLLSLGVNDFKITQGQMELLAIINTVKNSVCSGNTDALKVNLGLSFLADSGGVTVIQAIRPMTGDVSEGNCKTFIDRMGDALTFMQDNAWKTNSNNVRYGEAYLDIFKYFGGNSNIDGTHTALSDPGTTKMGSLRYSSPSSIEDNAAFTDSGKLTFQNPLSEASSCASNYIMMVSNGGTKADTPDFRFPAGSVFADDMPPVITGNSPNRIHSGALPNTQERFGDEWAYFLANTDVSDVTGRQVVKTFTVDVFNTSQDTEQTKLLKSMAKWGGVGPSGYYLVHGDPMAMMDAFKNILIRVAAVDSVFTAASLPVSTTTQGSFINQIFVGMFRPQVSQRWWGNLKQYQLGFNAAKDVLVVDADGASAVDSNSGFFGPTARSFWTGPSSFFMQAPSGTPRSASDLPDGAVVEKGGAAQRLRVKNQALSDSAARKVLTVPVATASGALSDLAGGAIGGSTTLSASAVQWIKGSKSDKTDVYVGYDSAATPPEVDVRPSIHGDVLHSRPVAVNFGKVDNAGAPSTVDNVVVFYGTNDGLLHAIDGRQGSSTGGNEYWSFLPIESYETADKNYRNEKIIAPQVNDATGAINTLDSEYAFKKYGVDGGIGVFASYASGVVSKAMIYPTMRRGGSAVYAFDVSGTRSGTNPTLSWVKRPASTGFSLLGQTWSTPKAVVLPKATYSSTKNVVVMFGGGYNPQEDDPSITTVDHTGKAFYIVDAFNGTLRKAFGEDVITGAVASDVTVVDSDFNGTLDRIYFADVQGGVYRVDMLDPTSGATDLFANWTIKKIAQFTGRKIFHAPDVVVSQDFIAVMVGTGDREKPLVASTSEKFYLIKDNKKGGTEKSLITQTELSQIASVANNGTITAITPVSMSADGCYFTLATNGEKVVNTPLSIAGVTYFGTNKPATSTSNSCNASLGEARAYQVPLFCGVPKSSEIISGGYPPSPVGGLVNIKNDQDVDELVPFVIGSGISTNPKGSAFEALRPKPIIPASRKKDFWRVLPAGTGNR